MNKNFFKNKMKEVGSFLQIMKGRLLQDDVERKRGAENALKAMDKEKKEYKKEIESAKRGKSNRSSDIDLSFQDKIDRERGDRDVSAI